MARTLANQELLRRQAMSAKIANASAAALRNFPVQNRAKALGLLDSRPLNPVLVRPVAVGNQPKNQPRRQSALTLSKPAVQSTKLRDTDKRMSDEYRDVCKKRPDDKKRSGGGGSRKKWVPWCR